MSLVAVHITQNIVHLFMLVHQKVSKYSDENRKINDGSVKCSKFRTLAHYLKIVYSSHVSSKAFPFQHSNAKSVLWI